MTYLNQVYTAPTPQSEPVDGQVQNSAGGYSFPVDDEVRMHRFLILGSEGGSYYASERELTLENIKGVRRRVQEDGIAAVKQIQDVSLNRRAPKRSPTLFALATAASFGDEETRKLAYQFMPEIARSGNDLFEFVKYADSMRGWGRMRRRAVANWYLDKTPAQLEYQVVKYRQRHGWTHRDLLRQAHPKPTTSTKSRKAILQWVTHQAVPNGVPSTNMIQAYLQIQEETDPKKVAEIITKHKLPWEAVAPEMLQHARVWQALAPEMLDDVLVRNLGNLTKTGAITPMNAVWAVQRIHGLVEVQYDVQTGLELPSKSHPLAILTALMIYRSGKSVRGSGTWEPVGQVVDALNQVFDQTFVHAPQTNKRIYLGIDVSGSMNSHTINNIPGFTARMAAAAMAMAVARREPNHYMAAFSHEMVPLNITAGDSLSDVVQKTSNIPMRRTDCAQPILDALEKKMPVDCFIILTDNESWAGKIHPAEALRKYRREMGIPAKLIATALVANEYSVADPTDAGMMDLVGFDTSIPQLIADFCQ